VKRWEAEEAKKPKNLRRPIPAAPEINATSNRKAYNDAAYDKYNNEALETCGRCGRTFLPDRLEIHLRSCKGTNVTQNPNNSGKVGSLDDVETRDSPIRQGRSTQITGNSSTHAKFTDPSKTGMRKEKPRAVMCHICGREFGTKSIGIH
jgi:ribosomal protein L37E